MKKGIVLAIIILNSISAFTQNDSISYSFFVAGHTSCAAGGFHPPFKQKFDYIKGIETMLFGILTGDIVSPNPNEQDWNKIDAEIDTLDMPVYFAVGNHDMENRPLFETRYGSTYYDFVLNEDLFIILDPNIDQWNISFDQINFVEHVLNQKKDSVNNVFLFFHQLLWVNDHNLYRNIKMNSLDGRAESINFWNEFLPLFDNVQKPIVMFAGDLGAGWWSDDAMYYNFQNITFIASGMGEGIGDNFIIVNVWSNNTLSFELIPLVQGDSAMLGQLTDHLVKEPELELEIFPNPAAISIRLQLSNIKEFSRIKIYDMQGAIVYSSINYRSSINVSYIQDGIYIVEVEYRNNIYHKKLIKR